MLFAVYFSFSAPHCTLNTHYCMLSSASFLLFTGCYPLSTVHGLNSAFLFTTRYQLSIASFTYPPWIHQSIVNIRSFNVYASTICTCTLLALIHFFLQRPSEVLYTASLNLDQLITMSTAYFSLFLLHFIPCCGAGAEESKLNCLPEPKPKLRIAAPAPFYLPQTWRNFYRKKK